MLSVNIDYCELLIRKFSNQKFEFLQFLFAYFFPHCVWLYFVTEAHICEILIMPHNRSLLLGIIFHAHHRVWLFTSKLMIFFRSVRGLLELWCTRKINHFAENLKYAAFASRWSADKLLRKLIFIPLIDLSALEESLADGFSLFVRMPSLPELIKMFLRSGNFLIYSNWIDFHTMKPKITWHTNQLK